MKEVRVRVTMDGRVGVPVRALRALTAFAEACLGVPASGITFGWQHEPGEIVFQTEKPPEWETLAEEEL